MNPLPAEAVLVFVLGFLRALGLLLVMPVFSTAPVPALVRLALAGMLGALGAGSLGADFALPGHWTALVLLAGHELAAGLLLGWAARFLFYALEFAGQIVSTEIGLILSTSLDPLSHGSSSPAAALYSWLGTMLFLLTGAYQECLLAFVRSFAVFPPGAAFSPGLGELVVERSAQVLVLAVQLAAPVLVVNFFVNFVFALLGRIAPSLDAYSSSVPVRLVAGVAMLGLSLLLAAQLVSESLLGMPEGMLHFLR